MDIQGKVFIVTGGASGLGAATATMLAGAGGWFIPGPDYLALLDIFDPAHPFFGDAVKAWIDQAQKRWTPTNRDRWYSLGVNTWAGSGRWASGSPARRSTRTTPRCTSWSRRTSTSCCRGCATARGASSCSTTSRPA